MCTIQEQSSRKSSLEGFLKKNRFFAHRKGGGNADTCELYWLIFWFHIVILCKISFHLIGHTIWFYTEIKLSYFEPPLLFCNGDSKNENLISLQKYRVRPIKWKGILPRLIIWNQKLGKHTLVESVLKMGLIFSDFENYSKIPPGKIFYLIVLVLYTHEHSKTTEKPKVMSFSPWIGCQTHVLSHRDVLFLF